MFNHVLKKFHLIHITRTPDGGNAPGAVKYAPAWYSTYQWFLSVSQKTANSRQRHSKMAAKARATTTAIPMEMKSAKNEQIYPRRRPKCYVPNDRATAQRSLDFHRQECAYLAEPKIHSKKRCPENKTQRGRLRLSRKRAASGHVT